ncbi:MAG: phage portal protein, partial [Candidatus Omnitrophota bacterium]|nr:phage portal protein [Candidatus Omnitrophota bacterium]
ELSTLRECSRDLVRNDGIAAGAVATLTTNIIGSGIRPQSRIDKDMLKIDEEYAAELQKQIERIWERWVPYADAGGRMHFYEIEELSERSRFVNGESLILPLRIDDSSRKRPYSFALQSLEADRLDTPSDLSTNKDIRSGVEIGKYGEPLSYYIRRTHPGDLTYSRNYFNNNSSNYERYPALSDLGLPNFFHLYHVLRCGQTRGEPFFAPVLNLFKDRFEYMEAELVAARVAACFAVFIKKENAGEISDERSTTADDGSGKRIEELSPGMTEYLRPGEDISAFNPNRPGGTFGMFIERILRDVASGLNMPYEILSKDFTRSNYSNMRASLLEARRFFMVQQDFVSKKLCQPSLVYLLEEAYLKGELRILDFYFNREAYVKVRWVSPGWQWIDPENEVAASRDSIDGNLSTLAEEIESRGGDWEDNLEQRARELKKINDLEQKYGIKMTSSDPLRSGKKDKSKENKPAGGTQPQEEDNGQEAQ